MDKSTFPYNLTNQKSTCKLPNSLNEISGISFLRDNLIVCIQDEKGIIFIYDIENNQITNKIKFAADGDYEGIAVVDQDVWVLRSDGTLFEVRNFESSDFYVSEYNTPLSAKNDTEGLAYNMVDNCLLIACKEQAETQGNDVLKNSKAIYSFDLSTKKLNEAPIIIIETDEKKKKTKKEDGFIFKTSGICFHPKTKHLYAIASIGKKILVFDENKELIHTENLPKHLFGQPEGITFLPNGTLLISNESKTNQANIHIFEPL